MPLIKILISMSGADRGIFIMVELRGIGVRKL